MTYFLPALRAAETVTEVEVLQENLVVGALSKYDILMKSPYPLYNGDLLKLKVPEQAAVPLWRSFEQCKGSEKQTYLKESLNSSLLGLNFLTIRVELIEGVSEIPIGETFGVQISMLMNPESTKPSDPFSFTITDDRENLVVSITEDAAKLEAFVMHATKPA